MSLSIYSSLPSVEDLDAMLDRNTAERNLIMKTRKLAIAARELADAANGRPLLLGTPRDEEAEAEPEPEPEPEPELAAETDPARPRKHKERPCPDRD